MCNLCMHFCVIYTLACLGMCIAGQKWGWCVQESEMQLPVHSHASTSQAHHHFRDSCLCGFPLPANKPCCRPTQAICPLAGFRRPPTPCKTASSSWSSSKPAGGKSSTKTGVCPTQDGSRLRSVPALSRVIESTPPPLPTKLPFSEVVLTGMLMYIFL